MEQGLRIGLMGAAKIAPMAVIVPASEIEGVKVVAVAARSGERAAQFASEQGIADSLGSYADLVAREDIDLIYNALPPSEHAHWTIEALRAGKHVLCEKPFAMDAQQAEAMVAEAAQQNRVLIEAYHYRYHAFFDKLAELLPHIGKVQTIEAEFSVPIPNVAGEFRYIRKRGGGAIMDLGCYPIHLARSLLGEEPTVTDAKANFLPDGTDETFALQLAFPSGCHANLRCTMDPSGPIVCKAQLTGSQGTLNAHGFVGPQFANSIELTSETKNWSGEVSGETTYLRQLRHVLNVIEGTQKPITGGDDAIAQMQVIDAAYHKAGRDKQQ